MMKLDKSLAAWNGDHFRAVFKQEVEALPAEQLPLQQGLSLSSYVSADPFKVMVIGEEETAAALHVRAGIFYSGIIAGCSCSDDPTPTDLQAEYCDLEFVIDKSDGVTRVSML